MSIFTSNLQKVKVKMIPSDGNNAQNDMQLKKKELDGNTVKLPFIPQNESETSPLLGTTLTLFQGSLSFQFSIKPDLRGLSFS